MNNRETGLKPPPSKKAGHYTPAPAIDEGVINSRNIRESTEKYSHQNTFGDMQPPRTNHFAPLSSPR